MIIDDKHLRKLKEQEYELGGRIDYDLKKMMCYEQELDEHHHPETFEVLASLSGKETEGAESELLESGERLAACSGQLRNMRDMIRSAFGAKLRKRKITNAKHELKELRRAHRDLQADVQDLKTGAVSPSDRHGFGGDVENLLYAMKRTKETLNDYLEGYCKIKYEIAKHECLIYSARHEESKIVVEEAENRQSTFIRQHISLKGGPALPDEPFYELVGDLGQQVTEAREDQAIIEKRLVGAGDEFRHFSSLLEKSHEANEKPKAKSE